ncbi:30S ribosomal protein S20 [Sporosarcina sp. G11-34]|uniref:30S ribosomal protein S20 n=1 Tax=Sporosarcina sp. G11-34 TaxID=2849605 RepID=UPI0022A97E35|nr:30S ribosomal protein S20 [Sporosarcina sp. G11-34]MCZ2259378.1 30S ribosomal protein S20 [Sporosarcina sp. G11-34]
MPNIKSAIKSVKQNAAKNVQNSHAKATMRTAVRKAEVALENKDENATELLRAAIKLSDTAARKGLIHKNTASRQKARLTKKAL